MDGTLRPLPRQRGSQVVFLYAWKGQAQLGHPLAGRSGQLSASSGCRCSSSASRCYHSTRPIRLHLPGATRARRGMTTVAADSGEDRDSPSESGAPTSRAYDKTKLQHCQTAHRSIPYRGTGLSYPRRARWVSSGLLLPSPPIRLWLQAVTRQPPSRRVHLLAGMCDRSQENVDAGFPPAIPWQGQKVSPCTFMYAAWDSEKLAAKGLVVMLGLASRRAATPTP